MISRVCAIHLQVFFLSFQADRIKGTLALLFRSLNEREIFVRIVWPYKRVILGAELQL